MLTTGISQRCARLGLVLLAGITGLLLTALPAQAQDICGDLDDVPGDSLELYTEELADEFGVDLGNNELCSKLTQNFVKACQTAVKDAVKCIQSQIGILNKQNQTACKALAGEFAGECAESYKNEAKQGSDAVKAGGEEESAECGTFAAEDYFSICMFGF